MSKFLVTGGAGFVGSHLVEELVKEKNDVVILDDFSNGSKENISHLQDLIIVNGSITDLPKEVTSQKYDGIFHLATHPRSFSLTNPFKDLEVNAKGMLNILELAKTQNIKLVFTSNSGICGAPDFIPVDETHKDKPSTPYDANKLVSEHYCKIYNKIYGVKSIIFRLATVYGRRQKVNLKLGWRPLIATLANDVYEGKIPTIFGSGNQTRDLIHVTDIVKGLIRGFYSDVNNAEVFLLSTNTETSVNKVLELILKIANKKLDVHSAPETPGDLPRMCLSYEKAKITLGYEPKVSLEEGIVDYYNWLKKSTN